MDSRTRSADLLIALACVAISAPLIWGGTSLQPRWWMLWIALLPLLWFAGRDRSRLHGVIALIATFIAWSLGSLNVWSFLRGLIALPVNVVLPIVILPAALMAIGIALWRRLLLRGRTASAVLSLPAFWVAIEYLNASTSPHSTWANLAYSQSDVLPLIQIASLTGVWGVSFVVFLVISTLGVLLSEFATPRSKRRIAIATTVAVAAVVAFGAWRLATPLAETGTLNVRMVNNDRRGNVFADDEAN